MNFSTNDLKLFISVAELSNITKAAVINNTVQSNVSARIKYLENQLNIKLFDRSTRKIELTEEGVLFLKLAKEIILSVNNFELTVNKNKSQIKRTIKIGCIQTTAAIRAPDILQKFSVTYPDIDFQLKTGTTNSLIKDVLNYKLDGAFITGDTFHLDLEAKPVIAEKLCIISPIMYPTLEKLRDISDSVKLIVFNNECSYKKRLEEILIEMEFIKFRYTEVETLEGIINSIERGIRISLLPQELITKLYSYRQINVISLPDSFSDVQTVFVKRKDFKIDNENALFFDSIIDSYGSTISIKH